MLEKKVVIGGGEALSEKKDGPWRPKRVKWVYCKLRRDTLRKKKRILNSVPRQRPGYVSNGPGGEGRESGKGGKGVGLVCDAVKGGVRNHPALDDCQRIGGGIVGRGE